MKNMKMSDVFPEVFQVEHNKSFEVQDATWYSYGSKYESDCDQDSAIEHAVLNHDRLVEENTELREMLNKHKLFHEDMHIMDAKFTIKESIELHRETCKLLNK